MTERRGDILLVLAILAPGLTLIACDSAPRNEEAIHAYYQYDFTTAREQLREEVVDHDDHILLNQMRLGLAALADGCSLEAEQALGQAFDLLSTAGLNADRTTGAVLLHEGVRIWKGEPFEQALSYHYVATLYAVRGDWQNARAAAANALFRLTDFGADQPQERPAEKAAKDDDDLAAGYTAVDTNFTLGFLMQAIGSDLSGAPGSNEQFDAAVRIDPDISPIVETLRAREYDTLLIVDYGKGPTKIAYGRDNALVKFIPQDRERGPLLVSADGEAPWSFAVVCDVNEMAQDHRWNNLEDVRRAKSAIGTGLMIGGAAVATTGRSSGSSGLIGGGLMLAGALLRAGAHGDTRYLEFVPQGIYVTPLRLETTRNLRIQVERDPKSAVVLPEFRPGTTARPRTVYLRMQGVDSPQPPWLTADEIVYGNDHTGVRPGEVPWILGGNDVSSPTRRVYEAYRASAAFGSLTFNDLRGFYADEDVYVGPGGLASGAPPGRQPASYRRHVLEGGTGLYTPEPDSMGYKRLMSLRRAPYTPKSQPVRNVARSMRVPDAGDSTTNTDPGPTPATTMTQEIRP